MKKGPKNKGKTETYLLRLSPEEIEKATKLAKQRGVKRAVMWRDLLKNSYSRTFQGE